MWCSKGPHCIYICVLCSDYLSNACIVLYCLKSVSCQWVNGFEEELKER